MKRHKLVGKCQCGHSEEDHKHQEFALAAIKVPGHGGCAICNCQQFTWVGWMEERPF